RSGMRGSSEPAQRGRPEIRVPYRKGDAHRSLRRRAASTRAYGRRAEHSASTLEGPVDLERILVDRFGYPAFRPGQEAIVRHVAAGGDALVVMPTGAGKSLCYQIPALARGGVGLVVSPLIALMKDQVDRLVELEIRATFLNSSIDRDEYERRTA